jgi:SsrA-binding protein
MKEEKSILAKNPTAFHNYEILEKYEVGIVLYGTEIKSIRQGKVNLKDAYAGIDKNGEVYVYNMHISPYEQGNIYNKDPLRHRKLLLNKREILKLHEYTTQKGFTLVPIDLYFKGNKVKMCLGVGRGKKLYDKREDLKKQEDQRKIERYMKN